MVEEGQEVPEDVEGEDGVGGAVVALAGVARGYFLDEGLETVTERVGLGREVDYLG